MNLITLSGMEVRIHLFSDFGMEINSYHDWIRAFSFSTGILCQRSCGIL